MLSCVAFIGVVAPPFGFFPGFRSLNFPRAAAFAGFFNALILFEFLTFWVSPSLARHLVGLL